MEDVSPGRAVTQALNSIGLAAGKKLYVELMAVVEGGVLKASALNLAQVDGRCQLPGTPDEAWRAAGNEPGWILAAGGERIVLKRHGQPDLTAPYLAAKQEGKAVVFAAEHLSVRLENAICQDGTGTAVFGWTASVAADEQTLQGCAWQR
jgi:putative lipoprotein